MLVASESDERAERAGAEAFLMKADSKMTESLGIKVYELQQECDKLQAKLLEREALVTKTDAISQASAQQMNGLAERLRMEQAQ